MHAHERTGDMVKMYTVELNLLMCYRLLATKEYPVDDRVREAVQRSPRLCSGLIQRQDENVTSCTQTVVRHIVGQFDVGNNLFQYLVANA
jgi:hypothetical protein